jgi:hypothetical protein
MFVRSAADSGFVGRALKDSLGDVAPAATTIPWVANPQMKVEIEADTVVL